MAKLYFSINLAQGCNPPPSAIAGAKACIPELFRLLILILLLVSHNHSFGVTADSNSVPNPINRTRLNFVIAGASAAYVGTMGGLYFAWYKDEPLTAFHFHNDLNQWLQMDKGGHVVSSYFIGKLGYEALRFSGVEEKKAAWYGGCMGSMYLTTIEIFDGFSTAWGASVSDLAANSLGSAMFISQQLIWQEQRILLKYSYHNTRYPAYRPDVLGKNLPERMLKDYNGISYWLSANLHSFGWKKLPPWLNVAAGYSADGLTGAFVNISGNHNGKPIPDFVRRRQILLSLDVDLTRIETRSRTLNSLFDLVGFIKIPFPTLELDSDKNFKIHPLYF